MKARNLRLFFHTSAAVALVFVGCLSAFAVGPGLTIGSTSVTVAQGATIGNVSTITVTPVDGFTGSVALTAALASSPPNAVIPPTLSFGATTPVSITGASAGTASLTIATTAPSSPSCFTNSAAALHQTPLYAAGGAALACIFLFGIPARRGRWQKILGMLFLLIALASSTLACGGGKMTVACPEVIRAGTTTGAYTITVTGVSGTTTATGTVDLTVNAGATTMQ